jgi:hypothetical protein
LQTGANSWAKTAAQYSDMSRQQAAANLKVAEKAKKFDKAMGDAVKGMGRWNQSFDHFMGHFSDTIKELAGGAVLGALIEVVHENTKDLSRAIQRRSDFPRLHDGDVEECCKPQACRSTTSPRPWSKYSTVMATMGTKRFFDLNMAMRKQLERYGMLGMSHRSTE